MWHDNPTRKASHSAGTGFCNVAMRAALDLDGNRPCPCAYRCVHCTIWSKSMRFFREEESDRKGPL